MKNLKIKRISALLAALMIGGTNLCTTAAFAEKNDTKIERFILTEEQEKDPNYSYIITDEYEDQFNDEEVALYNKIIKAIFNRELSVKLTDDEETNLKICNAVYHSNYDAALRTIFYDNEDKSIVFDYYYADENKQEEMFNFVDTEMDRIMNELFVEGMNTTDKLLVLYSYAVNNFSYCMTYPKQYKTDDGRTLFIPLYYLLKTNSGVCHTYSYFLDYFCQKEGINSYLVTGKSAKTLHMWNMIQLEDGYYYFFDITTAITRGRVLGNNFTCFGMDKLEYQMYDYSVPGEYRIDALTNNKIHTIKDIKDYKTYEYLGDHIFKLTNKYGKEIYFNTELKEIVDKPENVKTK